MIALERDASRANQKASGQGPAVVETARQPVPQEVKMRRFILVLSIMTAALTGSALAANEKTKDTNEQRTRSTSSTEEVRDWSKIDTNRDGYIQPEEMEKYLQAAWEQRRKGTTASGSQDNDKTQH